MWKQQICMSNKFKVGNIIQYEGSSGFDHEKGLKQLVFNVNGERYLTEFTNGNMKGKRNVFHIDSTYSKECHLVCDGIDYENGVPLIWGDLI